MVRGDGYRWWDCSQGFRCVKLLWVHLYPSSCWWLFGEEQASTAPCPELWHPWSLSLCCLRIPSTTHQSEVGGPSHHCFISPRTHDSLNPGKAELRVSLRVSCLMTVRWWPGLETRKLCLYVLSQMPSQEAFRCGTVRASVLVRVSTAVMNHRDHKPLGWESVYFYFQLSKSIPEGSQNRNSDRDLKQERKQRP